MKYLLFLIIILSSTAFSQELNCTVSVNMDNLAISDRSLLTGFKQAVTDYMSKTRFTNRDWNYDKIIIKKSRYFINVKIFPKI